MFFVINFTHYLKSGDVL